MISALTAAAAMWLAWLIGKEVRERHDAKTIDQEQAGVISMVKYTAQHNPSISVGDWNDEYTVDPGYDAIEAIRPQVT
jgi:hypothetical protein